MRRAIGTSVAFEHRGIVCSKAVRGPSRTKRLGAEEHSLEAKPETLRQFLDDRHSRSLRKLDANHGSWPHTRCPIRPVHAPHQCRFGIARVVQLPSVLVLEEVLFRDDIVCLLLGIIGRREYSSRSRPLGQAKVRDGSGETGPTRAETVGSPPRPVAGRRLRCGVRETVSARVGPVSPEPSRTR
jgi:hypothetical protein